MSDPVDVAREKLKERLEHEKNEKELKQDIARRLEDLRAKKEQERNG